VIRARLWASVLMVACLSCGDGGGSKAGDPALPPPGDPARGRAGNVLITDGPLDIDGIHDEIWIGFNGQQQWADFLAFREQSLKDGGGGWIGGHLVADPDHHLGFYFDADTTFTAENTAETNQTGIDLLKRNPAQAEQLQSGSWVVGAIIVRIVPGGD